MISSWREIFMRKQYVFGPVASRRLGVSLGVDLVGAQCCSLDCIYCEAGKTAKLTCQRCEYVQLDAVKAELSEVLDVAPQLDYITYSGAGEPTLNSRIGELSQWIKSNYPQYQICLLTNGTLLNDPEVRSVLQYVDLAMPNFDASSEEELRIINRPAPGISVESLAEGIRCAAGEYPGKLILELFVVPGVNDSNGSIERFAGYVKTFVGLKSIQLNTLDRPGVVDWIEPAGSDILKKFIAVLENICPVEAVGRFRYRSRALRENRLCDDFESSIIALVSRRPATAEDLALALNAPAEEVKKCAENMVRAGILSAEKLARGMFYSAV